MSEHNSILAHQFDDLEQQKEAATLGMWAFLATEVMVFGSVLAYSIYRFYYPTAFALASAQESWVVGFVNTGVLLGSSLTMALAVHAVQTGSNKNCVRYLLVTLGLGLVFLGVKAFEYMHLFHEHLVPAPAIWNPNPEHIPVEFRRPARLFFSFYFGLTGLHALHMVIGIVIIVVIAWHAHRERYSPDYFNPVEGLGLYWHFVDIVWIFLYPLLYLVGKLEL